MGLPEGYIRKGHVATLQIDHDAWAMLLEIAPTYKALGADPCDPAGRARRGGQ